MIIVANNFKIPECRTATIDDCFQLFICIAILKFMYQYFSNLCANISKIYRIIERIIQTMAIRQINCCRLVNPHFAGVIFFITVNYIIFVYEYMLKRKPQMIELGLTVFHILFALLLWSMAQAILSDPGRVPIYWGFFAEENDSKKRRYCLLCHSFKPERCHHCSTCQRCVLNMDHHCPWISNCVGFHNRKFFMLFLFYIIVTLFFCLVYEAPTFITEIIRISENQQQMSFETVIRGIGLLTQAAFFLVICSFFKFHVELVLSNSSTLDNLERQRNPNAGTNIYDVGSYENFQQVFGNKCWLWLFPISNQTTGNGVVWAKNQ